MTAAPSAERASHDAATPSSPLSALWKRQLPHYPSNGRRYLYLGVTVLATIILYYELYIQGAVATQVITAFGMSFMQFVYVSVIGNFVGAFGSLGAGLADRWGRANLVVVGLFITAAIVLFALPHAGSAVVYTFWFAVLSIVEGVMLVATPALIRDFSPQLGRASAMAFWTMGPVLGSLAVTMITSSTLGVLPSWQTQFYLCGIIGLVVAVIAAFTLRELSPALRDQLMVSLRDRAVLEARARNLDETKLHRNTWRQMLRLDIIGAAIAVSLFLVFYYIAVGFLVVYFASIFGYSESQANSLANWYWIANAVGILLAGVISDKLLVRKPFMLVGAIGSIVTLSIFAMRSTDLSTSYDTFRILFIVTAFFAGVAFCGWIASFTETVERHNPAATATGLAVYGWIIRTTITITLIAFGFALPATTTLMDKGTRVAEIAAVIAPETLAELAANPADKEAAAAAIDDLMTVPDPKTGQPLASTVEEATEELTYFGENAAEVTQAAKDSPGQWQRWWWISVLCQVVFIPFIFVMNGRWRPSRARRDVEAHEAAMDIERKALEEEEAAKSSGNTND
ncbi:MFS family permease [Naumannella cuiyingiana]|uniref:MFS family permease n=1 Tax=Naumannella cuiyingiana TaxID=1347891 RepID=A0A7Z0ILD0_9ACTN|nr:MFS transporter [Naumannella cuiyingiana]NYI71509.1 MFS family permease [Naumannella cuiyingiana]